MELFWLIIGIGFGMALAGVGALAWLLHTFKDWWG